MYLFFDLETSGLNKRTDSILEVGAILVDSDLREIFSYENVIKVPESVILGMDAWCTNQHTMSGLIDAIRGPDSISLDEAEEDLVTILKQFNISSNSLSLAGYSVHFDLSFVERDMRTFASKLSHRIVDVSTIRGLSSKWDPNNFARVPRHDVAHRALADCKTALNELRFYKEHYFGK